MAITEVYVDPSINANSGTGTIGDAFGDLQYALDTKTRDATNGDRFNIKAGTAEVLTAALSLATYGTPTPAAPLWIHGYTATAGDGGIGEIDGAGAYGILNFYGVSKGYFFAKDMKMGNCGGNYIVSSYDTQPAQLHNCEIYGNNGQSAIMLGYASIVSNCHIHTVSGQYAIRILHASWNGWGTIIGNYINVAATTAAIWVAGHGNTVSNNIIRLSVAGCKAITVTQGTQTIIGNTIYQSAAGTTALIPAVSGPVVNNIVTGASGTGGIGIIRGTMSGGNAAYNCATPFSGTPYIALGADVTLSSNPFIDAANGDFEIDPNSDAAGEMYPTVWKGLANTASAGDIGAVQSGPGTGGGGGGPVIGSRVIRGLGAI